MKGGAVVLRHLVFAEKKSDKHKKAVHEVAKANVGKVLKDLYQVDPEKRMDIIAKLDAAFEESKGQDDKVFFDNLGSKLREITNDLLVEKREIERIQFKVSELLTFIDFKSKE